MNKNTEIKSDAEMAALNMYPHDWFKRDINGCEFKHDQNAGKRAIALDIFKSVFIVLESEQTAKSVMNAFTRRVLDYELSDSDKKMLTANMSTALVAAKIAIRDCKK
mgnify:CR=1 FL=1